MAFLNLMVLTFAFSDLLAICFSQTQFELKHKPDITQEYRDEGSSQKLLEKNLHVPNSRGQTCTCQELQNELKHLTDENKEVKTRLEALERRSSEEPDNELHQSKRMLGQVGSLTGGSGSNIAGKRDIDIAVAFSTYLSPEKAYVFPPDYTLQFDVVLTNEGNAYDVATGEFTVPIDGLYFFSFSQVGSPLNNEKTSLALTIDGNITLTGTAKDMNMGGNSAVLHAYKGQKVRVQSNPTQTTHGVSDLSDGITSLSGFLIYVL